jgi:hypothetical protein
MDPITGMLGIAGAGLSVYSALMGSSAAKQSANISSQIAGVQEQENQQRQLAMQISARRQQTEIIRNTQRARAMSLTTASNQGAAFGSGLSGAQAGIQGQGAYNLQGVNQQLQVGNAIFGMDSQIDQYKVQLAQLGGQEATYSGLGALGGALGRSAGPLGNMAGNVSGLFSGNNNG